MRGLMLGCFSIVGGIGYAVYFRRYKATRPKAYRFTFVGYAMIVVGVALVIAAVEFP